MSILSTNHRLISIGESYSAGNGIDITDQVISVTGDATPYSAGDNIDIQGHVISGKDWTQDITDASSNAFNETTAWVHDNYANSADVDYLSGVVDNKLDTSAWSSVSSNFATEDYVIMADNITYDRTTGYVENQQFAKESACQSAFEQLNTNKLDSSSFTDWQNVQYSTDLQTIEGQITNKLDTSSFAEASGNFQPKGDYAERDTVYSAIESATSSKLDVSSFASVSSDFLTTSFEIPESATWNEVSTTVQSNSAQWADGGAGDEEVNSFVYNNSATINEVNTTYQTHSASYQPSGNYIPYTGYDAVKGYSTNSSFTIQDGTFTNSLGRGTILIQNRITSNIYTKLAAGPTNISFITPSDSAQVDISSINKWNEVSTTVQSNSAQWAEGGGSGDEEVNSLVHTNSATWNTVTNKLDTTAQVVTGFTTATLEGINAVNSLNGKPLISFRTQSAQQAGIAGIADKARYDYNGNNLADDHNSLTSLKDFVQSNSANYIPYSASGLELPNSNFKIDTSGQAYKTGLETVIKSPAFISNWYGHGDVAVTKLETGITYKLTVQGVDYNNVVMFYNYTNGTQYHNIDGNGHEYYMFNASGECTFTWILETTLVALSVPMFSLKSSNTTLTYTNATEKRYVLEDELSSGYLHTSGLEYNAVNEISAINGSAIAAGDEFPASADEAVQYVQTNSATINDVNISYKTNSANFIPYNASGVELSNSNFKIDTSGQAYKLGLESGTMPLEFGEVMYGFPDGALTKLENGVTYTLTIQGAPDNSIIVFVNRNTQSPYTERPTITNNQCTFTWTHEDAPVGIMEQHGKINSTSTTLTYTKNTEKRYALEDEFEYNAVGEISGYGNSAIAQYGAEKQWLVHDDTIVHIANSAQYAFGCNVSALQRLMGIDETVLWENPSTARNPVSSFTLSENLSSFKEIKFYYRDAYEATRGNVSIYNASDIVNAARITLTSPFDYTGASGRYERSTNFIARSGTNFEADCAVMLQFKPNGTTVNYSNVWSTMSGNGVQVLKVIGIGRKQ